MAIVRINGKQINTINGKKVRAIHYGDKTWYLENYSTLNLTMQATPIRPTITIRGKANTNILIDWGDGTTDSYAITTDTIQTLQKSTAYELGDYVVKIPASDDFEYYGSESTNALLYGNGTVIKSANFLNTSINNADYLFSGEAQLKSVVFPNDITRIGASAFYNCLTLHTLEIPSTVTSIGSKALQTSNNNNGVIIFKGSIPPTIESDTFNTTKLKEIRVPVGYGDVYKTWDTNWEALASYIVEGE